MGKKDPRIDIYIREAAKFAQPILKHLRKAVHAACPEVEETMKWRMPFFTYRGNLCHMAAFKHHCAFGFWKGTLIFGRREREGMGHLGKIMTLADLPEKKALAGSIKAAAELNDLGMKVPAQARSKSKKKLKVPEYLRTELKKSPSALRTFEGLSYSHKKEYVEWISEAKREETRQKRVRTALKWLADGKSRNWKWEKP
jgi:uncharacterized protein YdeI (YjbR/CyaY-like superfamily)